MQNKIGTAAAAALTAACAVFVTAQSPASRRVERLGGLEAIDTGLHETPRWPATGDGQSDEPHRLIVKFRNTTAGSVRDAILREAAAARVQPPPGADFLLLEPHGGVDPVAAADALAARPEVEYAQPSYRRHAHHVPNDPLFGHQWNLTALRMDRAWDINRGSTPSVIVAVIDSGVAFSTQTIEFDAVPFHLGARMFPGLGRIAVPFAAAPDLEGADRFVAPWDFVWRDANPVDMDGHGTHVAGTIGQTTGNGVGAAGMAFNVRLMPLKVLAGVWDLAFGQVSRCCGSEDADIAAAISYAASHGAAVINISVGGTMPSPAIEAALRAAVAAGCFVVLSAGNDYLNGNPVSYPSAYAAAIDGVVAVGAIGRNLERALYSATGPHIELVAPGGNQSSDGISGGVLQQTLDAVFSQTYDRGPDRLIGPRFDVMSYDYYQGTSMAAPHVAGFAALLRSQGITAPAAIEAAMKTFARDFGAPGRDDEFGYGLIDPPSALRGLGLAR